MSYTLRGRVESRLAALAVPLLAACLWTLLTRAWWPVELVGVMLAVALVLDAELYHRLLPYQRAWLALPLGVVELAAVMGLARFLQLGAPLWPALALYGASWLWALLLGQVALPLARLGYAQDGGELGRAGPALGLLVVLTLVLAGTVAWATQRPVVRLAAGVHQGPLVITRSELLEGAPGAVVRGGIVIRANHVTVRDLTVEGGQNGIDVEDATGVVLDRVTVRGAQQDGIHVRRSAIMIRDCSVDSLGMRWAQGIDISYAIDRPMSMVEGCTVVGGQEGIVTHYAQASLVRNSVSRTSLRGISMTEMSMGDVDENQVDDTLGVGILCSDHSMCRIRRNVVSDTRPDRASGDASRAGYGILVYYFGEAEVDANHLVGDPAGIGTRFNGILRSERS